MDPDLLQLKQKLQVLPIHWSQKLAYKLQTLLMIYHKNLNDLKLKKANDDKVAQEHYEAAVELGKKIEAGKIQVSIKTGEGGKVFGSVSSKEIAAEVKSQLGLEVDKKKVQLKDPIKSLGTHNVPIKLHPKVTTELKVVVTEEA